jgi:hypothetical protein
MPSRNPRQIEACGPGRARADHHHEQGHERDDLGRPVDQETKGFAGDRQQQAGKGRPDQAGRVVHAGVEGDGARQILARRHQVGQEGLADRRIDRHHHAEHGSHEDDVPDLDHVEPGERGERECRHCRGRLRHEQQLPPLHPVGPDAAEGREHQHCDLPGERRDAQQPGRAGQAVDQPAHGDLLHPVADDPQRLAEKEQPEVAVLERAQRVDHLKEPLIQSSGFPPARE